MLSLIWTLLIGLVIGAVAKLLMPGRDPGGVLITMVIGIAGSFVGSFAGRLLGLYERGEGAGFIMSVVGAMLLLWGHRVVQRRGS